MSITGNISAHDRLFNDSRGRSPPREPRPYAIDSRSGYLQMNHVGNDKIPITFDIFPVGPGAHTPKSVTRHISTPSLGRRGDHVHEVIRTPLRNFFGFDNASTLSAEERRHLPEKKEFATVFHDHHIRMAIDPNTRRTETPCANLTHDFLLEENFHDGKKLVKRIHFGRNDIPFGERNDYKKALPEYDPQFDSLVRSSVPRVKLGKILKSTRFKHYEPVSEPPLEEKPTNPFEEDAMFSPISTGKHGSKKSKDGSLSMSSHSESNKNIENRISFKNDGDEGATSNFIPKKKKDRKTPKFDDSCYAKLKHKVELTEQNPKAISDSVKANMFANIYTISRPHFTKKIDTQIIDRLKRYGNYDN